MTDSCHSSVSFPISMHVEKRPGVTTVALNDAVEEDATETPTSTTRPWRYLRIGVAVLLLWWGAWTLADRHLIQLSPWSEIAALTLGSFIFFWDRVGACALRHHDAFRSQICISLQRI